MLLAEANQWPEDSLPYFGDGDECHMAFHFPVMPRMYMSLAMEDRFPIIDIMSQTPPIPENCQWAMFLRNHDELTLEMVTDEDRDYMWRTYAKDAKARINMGIRRRLAPLLDNHRSRIHLLNGLLFSFPGTPIVYYGDEIGMGDNIYLGDRNGVRTPMQWSADRNAGFSRCNPQQLFFPLIIDPEYHYEQVNVEAQQNNQYSLLWWMKRLIAMRKRYRALGRGTMEFLHPENRKVLAYVRRYQDETTDETILVVANLSRLVQCFELDMPQFRGMVPVELSGGTKFPAIGDRPYFLNLGPFSFYWFILQPAEASVAVDDQVPLVSARTWDELFATSQRDALEVALKRYLGSRRWFGGKARSIANVTVADALELGEHRLLILRVDYHEGEPEQYLLPVSIKQVRREKDDQAAPTRIARLKDGALLYEPIQDEAFANTLLDAVARKRTLKADRGSATGVPTRAFKELRGSERLDAHVLAAEQSNTAIVYGQRLFLKLFRRLEAGINTDFEITRFLNEETPFANTPRVAGTLEYRNLKGEPTTLAILQGFTPNAGDAWSYTLDAIGRYFDGLLSDPEAAERVARSMPNETVLQLARKPIPDAARDIIGSYLADAELLGTRTAQLHLALASRDDDPAFAPEPFTPHYQRSIYQYMRTQIVQTMQLVRKRGKDNPELMALAAQEPAMHERIREVLQGKVAASRIRVHGDYHLGQVLRAGNDFVIIDFEGEPARPLSERRIKRSGLRDVAGMLRSFHYAPNAVLFGAAPGSYIREEDVTRLEAGARFWHLWVSAAFLRAYLAESAKGLHLPQNAEQVDVLLRVYLLEKALYEIAYELNNRPAWVKIPVRGVIDLLA
jgi:maltose alpha-D-glucosyltransferase/alpha-amylase